MNSITTLSLFRFTNLKSKVWAFGQMQFAHNALAKVQGLQFYKLMGSGRDLGFSPLPDWGVYALLCVWENEEAANTFFAAPPSNPVNSFHFGDTCPPLNDPFKRVAPV